MMIIGDEKLLPCRLCLFRQRLGDGNSEFKALEYCNTLDSRPVVGKWCQLIQVKSGTTEFVKRAWKLANVRVTAKCETHRRSSPIPFVAIWLVPREKERSSHYVTNPRIVTEQECCVYKQNGVMERSVTGSVSSDQVIRGKQADPHHHQVTNTEPKTRTKKRRDATWSVRSLHQAGKFVNVRKRMMRMKIVC